MYLYPWIIAVRLYHRIFLRDTKNNSLTRNEILITKRETAETSWNKMRFNIAKIQLVASGKGVQREIERWTLSLRLLKDDVDIVFVAVRRIHNGIRKGINNGWNIIQRFRTKRQEMLRGRHGRGRRPSWANIY